MKNGAPTKAVITPTQILVLVVTAIALAALTLIYGASYTLWMYKRVIFGPITNPEVKEMKDINCREFAILAILAIAVLGMGLYPQAFIEVVHQAANDLITHVAQSKI